MLNIDPLTAQAGFVDLMSKNHHSPLHPEHHSNPPIDLSHPGLEETGANQRGSFRHCTGRMGDQREKSSGKGWICEQRIVL